MKQTLFTIVSPATFFPDAWRRFALISLLILCGSMVSSVSLANNGEVVNVEDFNLQDYVGKTVYLDFWASWCPPCRLSFPWMQELHLAADPEEFVVVAVNLDKKERNYKKFMRSFEVDFLVVKDPEGTLAELFKLRGMPSSYIINKEGVVVYEHRGFNLKDTKPLEIKFKEVIDS